ncbi:MAG: hypothetical protein L3J21_07065 [Devosiaceae bacterium]|nr:hypothetical protein [Devosiaceae bacterium]
MQNPLLIGVRNVEVACVFKGEIFDGETKERICNLLINATEKKFGFPTVRNDEARPDFSVSGGPVRLGYFWIEAVFEQIGDDTINAQLTWGNSRPMRGVDRSQSADALEFICSEDTIETERGFVADLLDSINI